MRVALAGLRRVFSNARILESRATDELGDPELEGSLPGRGDTEVIFSSFLEIFVSLLLLREDLIVTDSILAYFLSEIRSLGLADATAFSRLPCFAGRHRPDRPPRSCLTRWLPSLAPLCSRNDYTRLLEVSRRSRYQIVAYPGDLLSVLYFYRVFCFRRWNEMKVVGEYEFGRVL